MRRGAWRLAATGALAVALAAPASASELVTWKVPSKYVDPAKVPFNGSSHPRDLRVNVLLPDGYSPSRRYPVLYLLHGHGDAYDSWAKPEQGDVQHVAAGLGALIVMPEGDRGWYTNWWNGGRRGDPAWERYHLDELIPLVESRLPILRGRRWHAIAGLSMGGEGALFYASQRPGYFGSAASFSGSISIQRPEWPTGFDTQGEGHLNVFGDPQAQDFYWTGHNPTALTPNLRHTRVFIAVGDGVPGPDPDELTNQFGQVAEADLHQHAEDFVAAARQSGLDVTYRPQQGIHDWPYWRRHLTQAIQWGLFQPVQESPSDWSYKSVAQSGQMWDLAFAFRAAPTTVETFTREGGRLRAVGSGTATLTTDDGCTLTQALPFDVAVPSGCARPRLRLSVRPRRTRVGRLTRFRFAVSAVTGGRRRAVTGATLRFAGHRMRTGRRGRARAALRLRHARRYRVRATKNGFRSARATVRVLR